jgi:serine/threonine protein kinase/Tol biopolymer transport system component
MMAPRNFSKVEKLYHEALDRPPSEREAFLENACGGDESLVREVQSLLSHEAEARRLLEEPAEDAATQKLSHLRGARLGRYEIADLIGSGGMGQVYRARDTALGRDVAIKVLPGAVANDTGRLRRFEQEARAAGALSHPNILDVHDIGTHEGAPYVVTELLEGETLRTRLRAGSVPIPDVLDWGVQIADGLAVAHDNGIVHRDLKPENLFLTGDGRVKILDFGLAKLMPGASGRDPAATATAEELTGSGVILGTAAYMSPEQARGEEQDTRTDLFSLGAVLYEMATGQPAFTGTSPATTIDAILREIPASCRELNAEVPDELERIITKALEKDRDLRYQDASDLRADLKRLKRDSDSGRPVVREGRPAGPPTGEAGSPPRPGWRRWAPPTAGAVLVILGGLGAWRISTWRPDVPTSPPTITPFTSDGGVKLGPRLSPDGEKVAYAWAGPDDDNWDIYVKALGAGAQPLRLTDDRARDMVPTWSPNGRQIAFVRWTPDHASVHTVPSLGGQERKLMDLKGEPFVPDVGLYVGLSWSPDGEWLAFSDKAETGEAAAIVRISLATMERQVLTSPPEEAFGDLRPRFSPDGRHLAFFRIPHLITDFWDLWVQPLDGGEARRLTFAEHDNCGGLDWSADGREILFACDRDGVSRLSLAGGTPRPVPSLSRHGWWFTVQGTRMVYVEVASTSRGMDLWRVPGRETAVGDRAAENLISSSEPEMNPNYSPNGRRIAFASMREGQRFQIWVCANDGSDAVQITHMEKGAGTPRWSPDGRRIVFDSIESGNYDLWVVDADGGIPRQLTRHPSADHTGTWSRDGRWIYFGSERTGAEQIWKMRAEGGPAVQVTRGGGFYALESWDRRHLYYSKEPPSGVWRVPVEGGEETEVVAIPIEFFWDWALSRGGIYFATSRWHPGRKETYTIELLDLESGETSEVFHKQGPFGHASLAVSPDERWILFGESAPTQSELMLVENLR